MNFKKKFQSKPSNVIEFPASRAAGKSNVARGKTKKDDRLNRKLEAARASHPGLEKHFQLLSKLHLSPYDVATSLEVPYAQKHPLFCVSFEDAKSIQKTSIFKEAISLLELARDNDGLRLTQTGNLKPDLCKYLWEKFYRSKIYYEAPRNELDLFQITRIKSLLLLSGYLDFRSKTCLELTDEGKDFLLQYAKDPHAVCHFYTELVDILMNEWNWRFGTRFWEFDNIEDTGPIGIWLVNKLAQKWTAPKILSTTFSEMMYPIAEDPQEQEDDFPIWDPAEHMFRLLFLERVAEFVGWLDRRGEEIMFMSDYRYKASALFKNSFRF